MSDQRDRDERGRFIKGNPHRFIAGTEKPSNGGKVGGVISGESKRHKKLLKEELREILNEETVKGSGITKQQSLIQNILKNTLSKGKAKDLKILCEVLGELEINVNLNQTDNRPTIRFSDE